MRLIDASKIKFKRCWISKGYNKGCDNHLIAFAEQIKTIPTFDLDKHDSEIRANERVKTIDEFAEMMRNLNTLNCFVDYVADEIDLEELMKYASEEIAEQMKEEKK